MFQAGVAELDRRALGFETWVYFNQLDDIVQLARRFPELSIILNHLGGPAVNGPYADHRDEMLHEWRRGLRRVAAHENVYLKIGGIGYRSFVEESVTAGPRSSARLADYWEPQIRFCVKTFGPSRCMFESNFPEDRFLCDYVVVKSMATYASSQGFLRESVPLRWAFVTHARNGAALRTTVTVPAGGLVKRKAELVRERRQPRQDI